jgi:methionine aminopeptidase
MQPGTSIAELSRVATRELIKRGYQAVDSPKRIGHGIGMARAEPPSLNEVETELHRPGMILALEPKVRSEKSAVHLEEDVLITEKGPEFLTSGCRLGDQLNDQSKCFRDLRTPLPRESCPEKMRKSERESNILPLTGEKGHQFPTF